MKRNAILLVLPALFLSMGGQGCNQKPGDDPAAGRGLFGVLGGGTDEAASGSTDEAARDRWSQMKDCQSCAADAECDDGDACTRDACDGDYGCCVRTPVADNTPCGDDFWCNGAEYCVSGKCHADPPPCPRGDDPCTFVSCDEALDLCLRSVMPDGASCADALFCNGTGETCRGGVCMRENPCPLTTGNPCTYYACDEDRKPHCVEEPRPNGDSCPDQDPCNGYEFCRDGACTGVVPACFDGNPCTRDLCDPARAGACQTKDVAIPGCLDCTGDPACDDKDECTADYCGMVDGVKTCEHAFNVMCGREGMDGK